MGVWGFEELLFDEDAIGGDIEVGGWRNVEYCIDPGPVCLRWGLPYVAERRGSDTFNIEFGSGATEL